jgi:hypothetical protein
MRWATSEILILCVSLVLYPSTSFAYLDPGTGSYGFQMLLAVALVLFFTGRVYWKKMRAKSSQKEAGTGKESRNGKSMAG